MEKKIILVTGIGGNVGQGIVRNLLEEKYNVIIIGTNILEMSAGNHLVDKFYVVPFSTSDQYIPEMIKIIRQERVNLVIPSTDYEMYRLSVNAVEIPCLIADATSLPARIYLDKFESYTHHKRSGIPFVETCLPSQYTGQYPNAIAKPREGRGSRGIIKNFNGNVMLDDAEYVIQKQVEGKEYTTAVYASYLTGRLVGLITMERTLDNGATTFCKVVKEYDLHLTEIAEKMIATFGIKGAFNIQSIITSDNTIEPFEVNCRISGTNSIRSHFGFKDVIYTVEELLFERVVETPTVVNGIAYRYLADVIYPEGVSHKNNSDKFLNF